MKDEKNIRLNVQIPEAMRFKLKELAAKRNMNLKEFVLVVLNEAIEFHDR